MSGKKGILKSTFIVIGITLLVKILGLLKQTVMAWNFGSNMQTDAYYIAEGFIGPINVVLFSAISVMFISVYLNQKKQEDKDSLVFGMLRVYFVIAISVVVIVILFARIIAMVIAPGYSPEELEIVTKYLRILSVVFLFYCIASIMGGVLEGNKIFGPNKLQGLYVSGCVIVACLFFSQKFGITAVIISTLVGYFLYMLSNFIFVEKYAPIKHLKWIKHDSRLWYVIKVSLPLMVGNAIIDLQAIVDKMIASGLGEGAVSNLYYAQVASIDLVSALFVTSIGSVFYSYFAGYVADGKIDLMKDTIKKGVLVVLSIIFIVVIIYSFSAEQIIGLLFGHGKFGSKEIIETGAIVSLYALGFLAMPLRDLLVKAHYAFQDTKTPMINGAIGVAVNCVVSLLLSKFIGVAGIAIGTTCSYFLISGISLITIKKHLGNIGKEIFDREFFKLLLSMIIAAVSMFALKKILSFNNTLVWIVCCVVDASIYVLMLFVLRSSTIGAFIDLVKKKRRG